MVGVRHVGTSNEYHRASWGDQVKFIVTQNATPSPPLPLLPRRSIMTAPFGKEFNSFLCAAGPFKVFTAFVVNLRLDASSSRKAGYLFH